VNPRYSDFTDYQPVNPPMPAIGDVGDCSKINVNHYQALNTSFGISRWPVAYSGTVRSFAKKVFPITPPYKKGTNANAGYISDYNHLLTQYSTLDDAKKALAHYFASGVIAGGTSKWSFYTHFQFFLDTIDGVNLDYKESVKFGFTFFTNALDGVITAALNKRYYDNVRPTTAMQCLFEGQTITSWKGPYQGCGSIPGKTWQAWFAPGRVNNPTPEYPCEHCVNFGAVAGIHKHFFGHDNFNGKNVTISEGTFTVEPKITVGNPGYIAGVTDVPNTGSNSIGYGPAQDIHLGWTSVEQFARDCSVSRIYLGAHQFASTIVGQEVGHAVADRVWAKVSRLLEGDRRMECKAIGADWS